MDRDERFKPVSFLLLTIICTAIFMVVDGGVSNKLASITYGLREGESVYTSVLANFICTGLLLFCLSANCRIVRVLVYLLITITFFAALLNSLINASPLDVPAIQLLLGDATTRMYAWDTVVLFKLQYFTATLLTVAFILCLIMLRRKFLSGVNSWLAVLPLAATLAVYFGLRGVGWLAEQFPAPVKVPAMVYKTFQRTHLQRPRHPVLLTASGNRVKHLVFLVDESVRGDRLQVNGYNRQTTPYLNMIKSDFFNYGIASSVSNCSASSNILLQTGVQLAQLPDKANQIFTSPNIFQYAKAAGYKTFYIPVRGRPGNYADNMSAHDFKYIDEAHFLRFENPGLDRSRVEMHLVNAIKTIIKQNKDSKVFIYALKEGDHFLYQEAFPEQAALYSKASNVDEDTKLRDYYDDALLWVVDEFMKNLLNGVKPQDLTVVYTSDHGQGLREKGDPSTHCKANAPLNVQGNVPLMIFPSQHDRAFIGKLAEPVLDEHVNKASQFQLFGTLLVLMGYHDSQVSKLYGPTLFDSPDNRKRQFVSGDLWEHLEKNDFDVSD